MGWNGLETGWGTSVSAIVTPPPVFPASRSDDPTAGASPSPSGCRVPHIKNIFRPMRILRFQITTARSSVFGRKADPFRPGRSEVHLFRNGKGVINLNAEISDGAFNLGVAE